MSKKHTLLKRFKIGGSNKIIWVTGKNEGIDIEKLTKSHIYNILKCFERDTIKEDYLGGKTTWIRILNTELER